MSRVGKSHEGVDNKEYLGMLLQQKGYMKDRRLLGWS